MFRRTSLALNMLFGVRVVVSFLSYALMARSFGTSAAMDAYWVAVTPTLVTVNLMEASGIGASMTFHALLGTTSLTARRAEIAGLLLFWFGLWSILAALVCLGARPAVAFLAPGLDPQVGVTAARLMQVASISLAFAPITVVCYGLMQAEKKFFWAAGVALVPPAVLAGGQLLTVSDVRHLTMLFVAGYVLAAVSALWVVSSSMNLHAV